MGNQKGLSLIESLLILVVITIIGNVGCSRQEAGKGLGNAGGASEPMTKQNQQQRGQPEKTDETAEHIQKQSAQPEKTDETARWITFVSPKGTFSLRHPKYWTVGPNKPEDCLGIKDFFTAGADTDLVLDCGAEYFGQIYVASKEGNQLSQHGSMRTDSQSYQNITMQKVMADDIEGTREAGTVRQDNNELDIEHPLPDRTKVVIYLFYAHGRTYIAQCEQRVDDPDVLRYFDLMVTKTLKFSS
jgi:hypothetical protein